MVIPAKTICEGKRVKLLERDGWEFAERKSATEAVAVVAVTPQGELILTEQYRRPVDARVIDLPAGLVGDEEGHANPGETAKKELEEETGFVCARVERLSTGPSSAGIVSEIVHLYRAFDVTRKGEGGGVGGEDITVHVIRRDGIVDWLRERERAGRLVDPKIWQALFFLSASS